jgi:hypothetical protein
MRKRGTFLLAAYMATAIAVWPALAQPSDQGGMMRPGGMMGKGTPGRGPCQGVGPSGMMGKGGPDEGMMGRGGMMGPGGMMGGMMGKGMMHSRPMMEARLAYTKADLEITDAQTDAWNAYADAVRARYAAMKDARDAIMKAMQSGNALERMDARIKLAQAKLDSLKALKPVTETLYNALTDEQKKKADKLLGGGCRMM